MREREQKTTCTKVDNIKSRNVLNFFIFYQSTESLTVKITTEKMLNFFIILSFFLIYSSTESLIQNNHEVENDEVERILNFTDDTFSNDSAQRETRCNLECQLNRLKEKFRKSWSFQKRVWKCDKFCQFMEQLKSKVKESTINHKNNYFQADEDNCNSKNCFFKRMSTYFKRSEDNEIQCGKDCQRIDLLKNKLVELLVHSKYGEH